MDIERVKALAKRFYDEYRPTKEFGEHMEDHKRRHERTLRLLTQDHVAKITEEELKELFLDTDAFGFWRNKERQFSSRVQKHTLEAIRQTLGELIRVGEQELSGEELKPLLYNRGLGVLLFTELLTYRFPKKYVPFSPNVTLPTLEGLGEDLKARMPHGERSNAYIYVALLPIARRISEVLSEVGFAEADTMLVDIFLWWLKDKDVAPELGREQVEAALRRFDDEYRNKEKWAGWEESAAQRHRIRWEGKQYPLMEVFHLATGKEGVGAGYAQKQVKALGFEVKELTVGQYWLFQARKERYDFQSKLSKVSRTWWHVTRYRSRIRPGDQVLLWQAGSERGIYGLGRIASQVRTGARNKAVVDVELIGRLQNPVLAEEIAEDKILSNMQVMRIPQGSNFEVSSEEWEALQPRLKSLVSPDPDAAVEEYEGEDESTMPVMEIIKSSLVSEGLKYSDWQIATFYTALQTKGFVLLTGINGTGKTKIAQHLARLMPQVKARSEAIVWGGGYDNAGTPTELNDGAQNDPVTDTWRPVSQLGSLPTARRNHTAVWTGNEMIVWGGEYYQGGPFIRLGDGARYWCDPN